MHVLRMADKCEQVCVCACVREGVNVRRRVLICVQKRADEMMHVYCQCTFIRT